MFNCLFPVKTVFLLGICAVLAFKSVNRNHGGNSEYRLDMVIQKISCVTKVTHFSQKEKFSWACQPKHFENLSQKRTNLQRNANKPTFIWCLNNVYISQDLPTPALDWFPFNLVFFPVALTFFLKHRTKFSNLCWTAGEKAKYLKSICQWCSCF